MTTFPKVIVDALRADPARIAFEHGDRRVTRGETLGLARRIAAVLAAGGLGPGRPVAIALAPSPEA